MKFGHSIAALVLGLLCFDGQVEARRGGSSSSFRSTSSSNSNRNNSGSSSGSRSSRSSRSLSTARKVAAGTSLAGVSRSVTSRRRRGRKRGLGIEDDESDDYVEFEATYNDIEGVTIYSMDVDNDYAPTFCLWHYDDDDDVDDVGNAVAVSYCVIPWSVGETLLDDLQWSNIDVDNVFDGDDNYWLASANGTGDDLNVTLELYVPTQNLGSVFGGDEEDNQLLVNSGKYRLLIDGSAVGESTKLTQVVYSESPATYRADQATLNMGGDSGASLTWPELFGEDEHEVLTTAGDDPPSEADDRIAPGYQRGDSSLLEHQFDGIGDEGIDFSPDMSVELEALGLEDDRPSSLGGGSGMSPQFVAAVVMAIAAVLLQ